MTRVPVRFVLACLVALAMAVGACASSPRSNATSAPTTPAPQASSAGPSPSVAGPTAAPPTPASSTPAPSVPGATVPAATPDPAATGDPGSSPSPQASADVADACTGSDDNRAFFRQVTAAVAWPVYCAVLPAGWFVSAGSYRLANGGRLDIIYTGPAGARVALSEGGFCPDPAGCVPPGTDAGEAVFGDLAGTLVALADGGWAIVVDRGAPISWQLVASGLDEALTRQLAAALSLIEG